MCLEKSPEFSLDPQKTLSEHSRRHCEPSWLCTRQCRCGFWAITGTRPRFPSSFPGWSIYHSYLHSGHFGAHPCGDISPEEEVKHMSGWTWSAWPRENPQVFRVNSNARVLQTALKTTPGQLFSFQAIESLVTSAAQPLPPCHTLQWGWSWNGFPLRGSLQAVVLKRERRGRVEGGSSPLSSSLDLLLSRSPILRSLQLIPWNKGISVYPFPILFG